MNFLLVGNRLAIVIAKGNNQLDFMPKVFAVCLLCTEARLAPRAPDSKNSQERGHAEFNIKKIVTSRELSTRNATSPRNYLCSS